MLPSPAPGQIIAVIVVTRDSWCNEQGGGRGDLNIYQIAAWAEESRAAPNNLTLSSGLSGPAWVEKLRRCGPHSRRERGGREKWVPGSCQNYNQHYSTRNFDFSSDSGQPIQDFGNFLAATQLMITDHS